MAGNEGRMEQAGRGVERDRHERLFALLRQQGTAHEVARRLARAPRSDDARLQAFRLQAARSLNRVQSVHEAP